MNKISRGWACAAAVAGLAGCGDGTADQNAAQGGASVTVELPEPSAPVGNGAGMEVATADAGANSTDDAGAAPVTSTDTAAALPPRQAEEPEAAPAPPEKPVIAPAAEEKETAEAPGETGSLPLPGAVIVRTIEKIGYTCGSIASSSRIEGSAGSSDYLIRCSSGATYRASNRTGRYRFSKAD